MAVVTKPADYFEHGWSLHSTHEGTWTADTITAGASIRSAQRLAEVAGLLRDIIGRLDVLGAEGLHYIIRDEAKRRRRAEKVRRARAARERAKGGI